MICSKDLYDNERAVSVLVGTLALIAVVVAGKIGIASILGSFSTDVSKQTSSSQSVEATKTPISISGSDNMDLVTRSLSDAYSGTNPSVRITFGAVSPDGVFPAINSKRTDIGALAGTITYPDIIKNPDIQTTQIGSSAVVVITNKNNPGAASMTYNQLQTFFSGGGGIPGAVLAVRSDDSGTTNTFYHFLGVSKPSGLPLASDADMIQYVGATPKAIGYADYGDVQSAIANNNVDIVIVHICDSVQCYPFDYPYSNLTMAAKFQYRSTQRHADGSPVWSGSQLDVPQYSMALIYPLYYVTQDKPNTVQKNFIDYTTSPAARPAFMRAYAFSVADF